MNSNDSRSNERADSPTPEIRSTIKIKGDERHLIKHVLIGSPEIVDFTTRQLEELGYAQLHEWATPLEWDDDPLKIVPDRGDVVTLMVRYIQM